MNNDHKDHFTKLTERLFAIICATTELINFQYHV